MGNQPLPIPLPTRPKPLSAMEQIGLPDNGGAGMQSTNKPLCDMNTKLKIIRGIDALLGILLAMLLVQTVSAETRFTNEFWISPVVQTNGGVNGVYGGGTLDCPFDGSTQDKFDHVMLFLSYDSTHQNATIHLLAGTYQTLGTLDNGGWCLQNGQKLMGSGIDNTIIQLSTNARSAAYVITSWPSGAGNYYCSNIVIADLTLDANYTPTLGAVSRGGLELHGTRLTVRRVKVIRSEEH